MVEKTRIVWGQCPSCHTPIGFSGSNNNKRVCGVCGRVLYHLSLVKVEQKFLPHKEAKNE